MSDLIGNPKDRFSCDAAHLSEQVKVTKNYVCYARNVLYIDIYCLFSSPWTPEEDELLKEVVETCKFGKDTVQFYQGQSNKICQQS